MDLRQIGQRLLNCLQLHSDEIQDVGTRSPAQPLQDNDPLDLVQSEAEAPGLRDKDQERQRVRAVEPIAGDGPAWRGQDAGFLVQAESLPAHPAACGDLPDQ